MYKSKRSKATDISKKVKEKVWERDVHKCVLCGSPYAKPNAHYIPRSAGGLGIEQNIVTLCMYCHHAMDATTQRQFYLTRVKAYLDIYYPNFEDILRVYIKE